MGDDGEILRGKLDQELVDNGSKATMGLICCLVAKHEAVRKGEKVMDFALKPFTIFEWNVTSFMLMEVGRSGKRDLQFPCDDLASFSRFRLDAGNYTFWVIGAEMCHQKLGT